MAATIKQQGDEIIITVTGRLDTATSSEVSMTITNGLNKIAVPDAGTSSEPSFRRITLDASELEYISSSGLRILLSLSKRYKDFRVVEVQPQVYDVLETTGFTKILTVERSLRQLSVDGCQVVGAGGVGTVFRLDGDTIIKVFREGTTLDEVRHEITMSKEAFVLGMPTAISFDIVKVTVSEESGRERLGLVYELLQADTLSSVVKKHPERIEEYAVKYAELMRQIHDIEVPAGSGVPSAIDNERQQVEYIRRYFPQESVDMLLYILDFIPDANRMLHMDLQTKNILVQDNELMLIDMGEMGYGHPMLDLGHIHSAMVSLIGDYDAIIGMPRELGNKMWNIAIGHYLQDLPADMIAQRKAQIEVAACVRNFNWLSLSDSFPEELIRECQERFRERVASRFDHIKYVCQTFQTWKL
ncbi:MAG: STAS domain-containing protein [Bacteroidaceae bacterium]|nr:STAS domain-containing protein [Bacteroidaceae bacterium]